MRRPKLDDQKEQQYVLVLSPLQLINTMTKAPGRVKFTSQVTVHQGERPGQELRQEFEAETTVERCTLASLCCPGHLLGTALLTVG